jgi:hypothetical protein
VGHICKILPCSLASALTIGFRTLVNSMAMDMKCVLSLLRSHLVSERDTPRGLGAHWKQAPVTLEDALGFVYPIPLELVNSWEVWRDSLI